MPTNLDSTISSKNSTTVLLGIGGVFTGEFEEVTTFSVFNLIGFSDKDSAANGLQVQWSSNGVNVDRTESTNLIASTGRAFILAHRGPYFRLVYTNGAQAQTVFRLQIVNRISGTGIITKPLKGAVTDENFAQLTQAPTMRKLPDGNFLSDKATSKVKGFSFASTQTAQIILSPTAGKRLLIYGYIINASGTVDASAQLFFGTNDLDHWLFNGILDVSVNSPVNIPVHINPPTRGEVDEAIKVTTSTNINFSGVVFYSEE